MTKTLDEFQAERIAANERIFSGDNRVIKRFFRLDGETYEDGALSAKTKELLGLVASLVLRCDDCISYHVIQCAKCGVTPAEFEEAFAVGLIVGGSIVIPHLRRAYARMDEVLAGCKVEGYKVAIPSTFNLLTFYPPSCHASHWAKKYALPPGASSVSGGRVCPTTSAPIANSSPNGRGSA